LSSRFSSLHRRAPLALAAAASCAFAQTVPAPTSASANTGAQAPVRDAGIVTIVGSRVSSLPTQIPTTIEGITGAEVETKINATDSEDALKYFPSLLVRKRYIGDYNHAVLSSRASGTGNSARSMVYADGILLSNYLGNGAAFTPRWGLVTPEEIERVDVLYGPFSAAYPGNSVGAVVDYVTRMPRQFEVHAKVGYFVQPFELYGTKDTYSGWQASASVGDRAGAVSWWLNVNRLKNEGQPMTFATKLVSASTTAAGTPVNGAVLGEDKSYLPWYLIGAGTQYSTTQDHAKAKIAVDLPGQVRAQYTLGWWQNDTEGQSTSYLTRASDGSPFYSGVASIGGRNYTVAASDFGQNRDGITHLMHGLSVASRTRGVFDWEIAASLYDYDKDIARAPTVAKPAADAGGAGRITDLSGTGWDTLALKGVWRPNAAHQVDLGLQQESYRWRQRIDNAADWINGGPTTPVSSFRGHTRLQSLYAQDTWSFAPAWKAVLGLRHERWTARDGAKTTGSAAPVNFSARSDSWLSPKVALGFQAAEGWALKLSTGRAVRVPTVGELFQGNAGTDVVTNPGLKPEKSWTTEFTSELSRGLQRLRTTLFHETTTDALYSQAIAGTSPIVNSVQNIDRIRTLGLETFYEVSDLGVQGLDLQASLTYADSVIRANSSYVSVPGDTVGRQQPRVPKWRASLLASYKFGAALTGSFGARYGSRQYGQLNNSDPNGFAYQGFSKYFTTDVRLRWKIDKQWSAAFGIDNLNNYQYWNFHPYPQRTYSAELRFDL
jgi:iron complex outermembrane receptor protein